MNTAIRTHINAWLTVFLATAMGVAFLPNVLPAQEQPPAQTAQDHVAPPDTLPNTPSSPEVTGNADSSLESVPTEQARDAAAVDRSDASETAQPVSEENQQSEPASGAAQLPHNLSPWGMFLAADVVVKAVMIGLALASVVTWTVWLSKSIELLWAQRKLSRAAKHLIAAASLTEAQTAMGERRGVVPGLLEVAATELRLSAGINDKTAIKERVASRLDGLMSTAGRNMNQGTGVLATIGSTAPFVGLFGTVWGIMNSFIGISESQTTNLAVVAPGIAEALLATAIGLVAAIPAVIIYNSFARAIAAYRHTLGQVAAEVLRIVSRDLDRGIQKSPPQAAE